MYIYYRNNYIIFNILKMIKYGTNKYVLVKKQLYKENIYILSFMI